MVEAPAAPVRTIVPGPCFSRVMVAEVPLLSRRPSKVVTSPAAAPAGAELEREVSGDVAGERALAGESGDGERHRRAGRGVVGDARLRAGKAQHAGAGVFGERDDAGEDEFAVVLGAREAEHAHRRQVEQRAGVNAGVGDGQRVVARRRGKGRDGAVTTTGGGGERRAGGRRRFGDEADDSLGDPDAVGAHIRVEGHVRLGRRRRQVEHGNRRAVHPRGVRSAGVLVIQPRVRPPAVAGALVHEHAAEVAAVVEDNLERGDVGLVAVLVSHVLPHGEVRAVGEDSRPVREQVVFEVGAADALDEVGGGGGGEAGALGVGAVSPASG